MRRLGTVTLALAAWWLAPSRAQEAELPPEGLDLDFLEYLGSWAEEDDEWLELEEFRKGLAEGADDDPEEAEKESGDEDESE